MASTPSRISRSTVAEGTIHSIIGPNGAGKTTLLNLLTGVYVPSAGASLFDDRELTGDADARIRAGGIGPHLPEPADLFQHERDRERHDRAHLRERSGCCRRCCARLASPCQNAMPRKALELMRFLGLADYAEAARLPMPYGALKRLEIARALAGEPQLLLLDEPAAGLNPTEALEIDALIRQLAAAGTTVVLVEHDMHLVMNLSDHILVLDYGRRLSEGTAEEVRNDPRVIEAYLGVANSAEAAHA